MERCRYKGRLNLAGEKIRLLRKRRGLSQEQLADKVQTKGVKGFTDNAISDIENGSRTIADFELKFIAEILKAPIDWLLEDTLDWDWDKDAEDSETGD